MPGEYIDHRGRTERAFKAYVELMDAAERLRKFMSRQLETFDLTMVQFRVLEMIYRKGPRYQEAIARRLGCTKQNVSLVLDRREREGWIKRVKPKPRKLAVAEAGAPGSMGPVAGKKESGLRTARRPGAEGPAAVRQRDEESTCLENH